MGWRIERRKPRFFLPIGQIGALENDILFFIELFGIGYDSILKIPWSRRKRYIHQKEMLERKRASKNNTIRHRPKRRF